MKVKIHIEIRSKNINNLVYLIRYANWDIKIVNCSYFFDPKIIQKFDRTEVYIRAYYVSVLNRNSGEW